MIGWWIVISSQTPEERDAAEIEARKAAILAQWKAGLGGIDWIEDLVKTGKAEQHSYSGYPNRYTAKATDVLQLVIEGSIRPPNYGISVLGIDEGDEYAQPPGWMENVEIHHDRIATCLSEQLLTIDAWDQS